MTMKGLEMRVDSRQVERRLCDSMRVDRSVQVDSGTPGLGSGHRVVDSRRSGDRVVDSRRAGLRPRLGRRDDRGEDDGGSILKLLYGGENLLHGIIRLLFPCSVILTLFLRHTPPAFGCRRVGGRTWLSKGRVSSRRLAAATATATASTAPRCISSFHASVCKIY